MNKKQLRAIKFGSVYQMINYQKRLINNWAFKISNIQKALEKDLNNPVLITLLEEYQKKQKYHQKRIEELKKRLEQNLANNGIN